MDSSSLPLDSANFLTTYINSIGDLEVLFLLYNHPSIGWDANSISQELRSNITSANTKLDQLASKNLIKLNSDNKYIYSAPSKEIQDVILNLHELYKQRPVAVIAFIYEKPVDKLKGFADAFKLKKDS